MQKDMNTLGENLNPLDGMRLMLKDLPNADEAEDARPFR